MEENILFFFLTFLIFFLAIKIYQSRIHHKNHPPGPPAIPVIGHLHLLKLPLHHTFHDLSKKYGSIVSLRFGSRPVIIISSLSLAEECFTKNDIIFANRPRLLFGKHLAYNYTTLSQASYGHHWRNLRRISTIEIFSTHRLNVLQSIRKDEVKRLINNLASHSLQDFAKVEMESKFQYLTFNILIRMIDGNRYCGDDVRNEKEAKEFRAIVKEVLSSGGKSIAKDFLPILKLIDCGRYERKLRDLGKRADEFYQRLIDEHKNKNGKLENKNTMLAHLLSLQESEPEYYTDEFVKGLMQIMLFAGADTSSVTLEWALSNLINHPSILRKARDEIESQVGEECLLQDHHLSKLPYLQNIICETLRLHPAAPLLVPHMSTDDCTVGGYDVPRGTILLVNAWAIHRDPTLWDDPTSFKPERFETGEGELGHKLIPFGLGRRSCPGSGLAQRVMGLALGSLIQCFEWRKFSEKEVNMEESKAGLITPKAEPLEAMCKARPIVKKILSRCP